MPASIDALFERYRDRGDLAALAEVFDRTAPLLLRIAAHLCHNRADAEDAVQATWLRAIEVARSWDAERPLAPWLLGMLHNRVRQRVAAGGRRVDPERVRQPVVAAAPDAAAEGSELAAAVAATIARVPEQYQPVLTEYLVQQRTPDEIATVLGRRAGTVRSQLARGLRAVRRMLPAGFTAVAVGAAAPVVSAQMRRVVLAEASAAASAVVGAAGLGSAAATSSGVGFARVAFTPAGGAIMQKVVLGAAAAALVIAWLVWPADPEPLRDPGSSAATQNVADPITGTHSVAEDSTRVVVASTAGSTPVEGPIDTTLGRVHVLVADRSGAGVADVLVQLTRSGEDSVVSAAWSERTDADGVARFAAVAPGEVELSLGRAEYSGPGDGRVWVRAGSTADCTLTLRGVTVSGVVVDAAERPVPDARIVVYGVVGNELGRTDENGQFSLPGLGGEVRLGARKAGYAPSAPTRIPMPVQGRVPEVRLQLPDSGGSVTCTVRDPNGATVPGARVALVVPPQDGEPVRLGQDAWSEVTDAAGVAVFDGVAAGSFVVLVRVADFAPWRGNAVVSAGADAALVADLQPGATLRGHVRDEDGNPVEDCAVRTGVAGSDAWRRFGWFAHARADSDASGAYEIRGLPAGQVWATATIGRKDVATRLSVGVGEVGYWDPVVARSRAVVGRILGPDGEPLRLLLSASSPGPRRWYDDVFSDASGRFVLHGVDPDALLRVDAKVMAYRLMRYEGPVPESGTLEMRVPREQMATARIAAQVVGADGQPLVLASASILREGNGSAIVLRSEDEGWLDLGPLPAGRYRLLLESPGSARLWTERFELAAGETRDLGRIVLQKGCGLDVQFWSSAPDRTRYFPIRMADGTSRKLELEGGAGSFDDLPSGRHRLIVWGADLALEVHEFVADPSARSTLQFTAEPGVPTTLTVRSAVAAALARDKVRVGVRLFGPGDRLLLDTTAPLGADGKVGLLRFGLRPGAYRVELTRPDGSVLVERRFVVEQAASACRVDL